jgi:hypothetical protein
MDGGIVDGNESVVLEEGQELIQKPVRAVLDKENKIFEVVMV